MNTPPDDFANLPLTGPEGLQAEYVALREELLKRIEARQQILSLSLTIAGAYLGVAGAAGRRSLCCCTRPSPRCWPPAGRKTKC